MNGRPRVTSLPGLIEICPPPGLSEAHLEVTTRLSASDLIKQPEALMKAGIGHCLTPLARRHNELLSNHHNLKSSFMRRLILLQLFRIFFLFSSDFVNAESAWTVSWLWVYAVLIATTAAADLVLFLSYRCQKCSSHSEHEWYDVWFYAFYKYLFTKIFLVYIEIHSEVSLQDCFIRNHLLFFLSFCATFCF